MRSLPTSGDTASLRLLVHVVPGLEDMAADEIAGAAPGAELAGVWKHFDERTSLLEYRAAGEPSRWLALGTVEDVFALAVRARSLHTDRSGLHELAAAPLTSKHLDRAMRAYTACRGDTPRTFRVVARKSGTHAYRRLDAQRAVEGALRTRLPKLRLVADDADAEFWLSVIGREALVGLRLSTGRMRGHAHPFQSLPASLKPTVARAMVRLSLPRATDVVLDPLCGAGTLLIERALAAEYSALYGSDRDPSAVAMAAPTRAPRACPSTCRSGMRWPCPCPTAASTSCWPTRRSARKWRYTTARMPFTGNSWRSCGASCGRAGASCSSRARPTPSAIR